ncbi:AAA family ATPase [Blastococcus sp. KM273128]|uniref:AAA family ATPase n=1 Tax=Blastococcus sp. KM273128 TaxID=2570314 RepID=UPI001F01F965|nr:AAA family ATPase [Blastococcus sp. KM273128]
MTTPHLSALQALEQDWNTQRHGGKGWPRFLSSVKISGLRGWEGELVEFRFPVVAIAGENGSGKSTILKAGAAAYKNTGTGDRDITFNPDDFFPSTAWEDVGGVALSYSVRQGDSLREYSLRKATRRWRGMPGRAERRLFFLDISRTQPIDTLIGYGKIAKDAAFEGDESELTDENRLRLSRIMRRTYTGSRMIVQKKKSVGVLSTGDRVYSNFHQGAGEDTMADLVALLQDAPEHSLVIIDEVEASLHPRAQRRLLHELIDLARRKRMQFILSTHSPFVLEQLPAEARIYIQNTDAGKEVIYGASAAYALTLMDEIRHPDLTVYCEDEADAVATERILGEVAASIVPRVHIVAAGPANVVQSLGELAMKGVLPGRGVGVLDGDQEAAPGCVVLPGGAAPERVIFEGQTTESIDDAAARLGVRAGDLAEALDDARRLPQHHTWPRRTAAALGPRHRADRVWDALVAAWVGTVASSEELTGFADGINAALNGE